MTGFGAKLGNGVAKVLGIQLENNGSEEDPVTRGESVLSMQTSDSFVEGPPTTAEWFEEQIPSRQETAKYLKSLFPFLSWIPHYNIQWLAGDAVAGITIGAILVPQGMAYALLANLEPQYGLYSSFMGVIVYWIFGTSKDISIGPVAVLSTVVGTVVQSLRDSGVEYAPHVIASALSIISGCIVLGMGLLRIGWIVDLISITSLSAFMTGSAITIGVSQLPALFGLTGFSNRDAPYKVVINTLKHLPETKLDAAMGLTALAFLYIIRYTLTKAAERYPAKKRIFFFGSTMRTVFIILLYTMISWLVNRHRRDDPAFKVLGKVPKGFRNAGAPVLDSNMLSKFASHLPATVIVMLVEHIAISKAFGKVNNYIIDPSQEMVAIGITNILGPFLGAYPSTGSFSRTAVNSKAGVRTPAAGIITGLVVLLATYLLTSVFFYIPSASLAAVIIHAVGDLITPPNNVYQFWRVSPIEVLVFFVGVFVSVFVHIEEGLYATVALSAAILLFRILKARGRFMGKVRVHSVLGDHVIGDDHKKLVGEYGTFEDRVDNSSRNIFLPLDHGDGSNPEVELDNPYPGIFIYRFSEGFNYPNASCALEYLTDFIKERTRRSSPETFERKGDRPWNNPGPKKPGKGRQSPEDTELPTLKAIILDFSSVNNVDITSVQRLIDVRNQLDLYAAPDVVDWHIACINNRWTKRALIAGGFGVPTKPSDGLQHRWKSIFSVAEIGGKDSAAAVAEDNANARELRRTESMAADEELGVGKLDYSEDETAASGSDVEKPVDAVLRQRRKGAVVNSLDKPLFHIDLTNAVQSAIVNAEARQEARATQAARISMPLGIQRLNAKTSQPNPQIVFIKPLAGRDEAIARSFLERIAAQCLPVMRDNHLSVMSLEEFEPNREFVGRNFNAGEVIQLVLKSPSSGRWLPFEYVQMVMMHELAHCKQMNHSRAFWAVRNQYATQMYGLWSKGYTGDGLWGRGANLATGQWEKNTVRDGEVLPEHLCGGTYRSRRKRKGKQQLSYQERKQRRIEKKFGKNGVALGDDEATKVKLEKGKRVQAKPRVAGSARGRELRAAAALARFGNQKKVKQEDLELKEEYDSDGEAEEDQEPDAMDFDGSRIVDGDGRGMVKVCEDEDATDPSAKSELDELRGVFNGQVKIKAEPDDTDVGIPASLASTSSPRIKEEPAEKSILTEQLQPKQPQQQRPKLASPGVKREAAEESDQPPRLEGVKNEAENRAICRMCSFENSGHSLTCAMCSNVLEPDLAPSCWTCTSQACSGTQYVNAGDCGVCGLCGQRRP